MKLFVHASTDLLVFIRHFSHFVCGNYENITANSKMLIAKTAEERMGGLFLVDS
jgi:hypothetical protein